MESNSEIQQCCYGYPGGEEDNSIVHKKPNQPDVLGNALLLKDSYASIKVSMGDNNACIQGKGTEG